MELPADEMPPRRLQLGNGVLKCKECQWFIPTSHVAEHKEQHREQREQRNQEIERENSAEDTNEVGDNLEEIFDAADVEEDAQPEI